MTSPLSPPFAFDAWINALPGEPRFGLRGSDPEAPATVQFWADTRRKRILAEAQKAVVRLGEDPRADMTPKLRRELKQCSEAEEISWLMIAYQQGHLAEETTIPEEVKDTTKNALYYARRVDNAIAELTELDKDQRVIMSYNVSVYLKDALAKLLVVAKELRNQE